MAPKKKQSRAEKAAKQDAHLELVLEATKRVVGVLTDRGFSCGVFGSLGSKLYGAPRCPKDVDLVVFQDPKSLPKDTQPLDAAELKTLILDNDPQHFFLKLPKDPAATYRILHYRESYGGAECKVDILVPGTMHLPYVRPSLLRWVDGVPVVPFGVLLLHKLQGWDDHRLAEEPYKQRKQVQDAADIKRLLGLQDHMRKLVVANEVKVNTKVKGRGRGKGRGKEKDEQLEPTLWWRNPELFSEEFQDLTKRRVKDYCQAFPDRAAKWKSIGFNVDDDSPPDSPQTRHNGIEKHGDELGELENGFSGLYLPSLVIGAADPEDDDETRVERVLGQKRGNGRGKAGVLHELHLPSVFFA